MAQARRQRSKASPRRRTLLAGVTATVAALVAGGVTVAVYAAGSSPQGGASAAAGITTGAFAQAGPAAAPVPAPGPSDTPDPRISNVPPWLAGCYAHPTIIDPATCVANTTKGVEAQASQFATSVPAGQVAPALSQIEAAAREVNNAPATAPTFARQMTYAAAVQAISEGLGRPGLSGTLPVWLITVDAPADPGSRGPSDTKGSASSYTVIVNAADGKTIDYCAGCNALTN